MRENLMRHGARDCEGTRGAGQLVAAARARQDPMRAYPSQKMPPVFAGGIVISILNGGR